MDAIPTTLEFLERLPLYSDQKPYIVIPAANNGKGWKSDDPRLQNLKFSKFPVKVNDMRSISSYSLSETGFDSFRYDFGPFKFTEQDVLEYRKQTEEVLKERYGAEDVICYDFRYRKNEPLGVMKIDVNDPMLVEGPPTGVHIGKPTFFSPFYPVSDRLDLTAAHAPSVVKPILSAYGKSDKLKGYRIRIMNTWRPMVPKLEDRPLAVCDFRSIDTEDVVAADRIYPHRETEFFYLHHNENQRWYWLSGQTPEECVVMLMFDTHPGKGAKYCPHVSFPNPYCRPDAPPRESVETRSIVITRA